MEKKGDVLEVVMLEREQMTYLEEGRVCPEDQGQGGTIQIN